MPIRSNFPDAVYLKELNYEEVIEMAYYGCADYSSENNKALTE